MPLFSYKCSGCEQIVERFQHNTADATEMVCDECAGTKFERLPAWSNSRTRLNARDALSQKILPDADRIKKQIEKGNDSAFFDIYGDK